mmetsp:Transcript_2909/g.6818  ORF Transcript_2909/g.6818 Transcript_2909/m.6818 type:complete len:125 (+) Transcript_2909:61-435(+)
MMSRVLYFVACLAMLLAGGVEAFMSAPALGGVASARRVAATSLQMAHHVNPKGAKKHRKNRPRKSRPSDMNRAAPPFNPDPMSEARQSLPEFEAAGSGDTGAFVKVEKDGKTFYHIKTPFLAAN